MRVAGPSDLAQLVDLEEQCEGTSAWSAALIAEGLAGTLPTTTWYLDDRGYAVLAVVDDVAELQRIGVHPDHRRAGHARRLLTTVIEAAAAAGAERLLLEVRESNAAALGLYTSAGFTEISRRRRYYPDGETAVVMELALRPSGR